MRIRGLAVPQPCRLSDIPLPDICTASSKCHAGNVLCSGEIATKVGEFVNNLQFYPSTEMDGSQGCTAFQVLVGVQHRSFMCCL